MPELKAFNVQVTQQKISDWAWFKKKKKMKERKKKKWNPFLQTELTDSIYATTSAVYQVTSAYKSRLFDV